MKQDNVVENLEQLQKLAKEFSSTLETKSLILLQGQVGVGKTTFTRKAIQALVRDDEIHIKSPTFSIFNEYELGQYKICHADFYRIKSVEEIFNIDFERIITDNDFIFIEWPTLLENVIAKFIKQFNSVIKIYIEIQNQDNRLFKINKIR